MALIGSLNILLGLNAAGVAAGGKIARASLGAVTSHAERAAHALESLKAAGELIGVGLTLREGIEFLKSSYEAFHEAELQQRKLEAVLETTGHAAGFTADQLRGLNSELQAQTNYDDDAIAAGEAILATFKQIQGVQFEGAIESMLDMSAVLDQDLKSSAIMLGKALNDPLRGITALRRAGVSFTEQQTDQIKAMVEAGDIVSAQTMILKELKSEFGGTARAMRSEVTGLVNDWGDLKETIGSLADSAAAKDTLNAIAAAVRGLNEALQDVGENGVTYSGYFEAFKNASNDFGSYLVGQRKPQMLDAEFVGRFEHDPQFAKEHANEIEQVRARMAERAQGIGASVVRGKGKAAGLAEEADAARDAATALDDQASAQQNAAKTADTLAKDVGTLTQRLQLQAATFGMSADEAQVFELASRGATQAQLAMLRAAQQQIAALNAQREAQAALREEQERMAQEAKSIWEQTRTPLEKYEAQVAHLKQLRGAGAIDQDTFTRAQTKAHDDLAAAKTPEWLAEFEKAMDRLESLHQHNRVDDDFYAQTKAKLRDQFNAGPPEKTQSEETSPERAGPGKTAAVTAGSAEAYSAIVRVQNPAAAVEKQSLAELREIRRALAAQAKADRRNSAPNVIRRI